MSLGHGPRVPSGKLTVALALDRIKAAARTCAAVVRLHPAGSTLPVVFFSVAAVIFVLMATVSIHVLPAAPRPSGHEPVVGGVTPVPATSAPVGRGLASPGGSRGRASRMDTVPGRLAARQLSSPGHPLPGRGGCRPAPRHPGPGRRDRRRSRPRAPDPRRAAPGPARRAPPAPRSPPGRRIPRGPGGPRALAARVRAAQGRAAVPAPAPVPVPVPVPDRPARVPAALDLVDRVPAVLDPAAARVPAPDRDRGPATAPGRAVLDPAVRDRGARAPGQAAGTVSRSCRSRCAWVCKLIAR